MYNKFQLALKYAKYYLKASNSKGHGTHSPFVYSFIRQVLNDRSDYEACKNIEQLRQELYQDHRQIRVEDFGAGSGLDNQNIRAVSSIARNAAKPKKLADLLFRISRYYKPDIILELGTSLGISTASLASGNPGSRLFTGEGSKAIAEIAAGNFSKLGLSNITINTGNFDDTLDQMLKKTGNIDLAFIDGNHRREPTLRYFNQIMDRCSAGSIIIFDDIHWSREMEEAWEIIKQDERINLSVDLFFLGIVFLRPEMKITRHFRIRI